MWFLFGEVSSSSGCLGWAALFYCGTPCAFHIIILLGVFDVSIRAVFAIICLQLIFSSGKVADGPSFEKGLFTRFIIRYICNLSINNFNYSPIICKLSINNFSNFPF